MITKNCANCNHEVEVSAQFCASCGQKTNLHRISMHEVAHDAVHYFTHADKGVLQLLKQLTINSGTVAREYIAGKRKKYFPPLNFFLLVAAIYVLVFSFSTGHKPIDFIKLHPEISYIKDPGEKQQVTSIYRRQSAAVNFMNRYSNFVAMVALPFTAFIFWLFYRRGKYNYTEHLVAGMYMSGFCLLVQALLFIPLALLFNIQSNFALVLFFIFQLIYCSIFYYRFINTNTSAGKLKAFAAAFIAILAWVSISFAFISVYISTGVWGLTK